MKKFLVMFFVVCALAFVYGCGSDDSSSSTSAPTTTQPAQETATAADKAVTAAEEAADAVDEAVTNAEEAVEEAQDTVEAYDGADPFADRPAITQADVDAYIKAIPKIQAAAADTNKMMDAYKEVGWDEISGAYVLSKVGIAYAIAMSPAQADIMTAQLPDSLKPSQAEIDLVIKNQDKITQAIIPAAMDQ